MFCSLLLLKMTPLGNLLSYSEVSSVFHPACRPYQGEQHRLPRNYHQCC